MSGQELSADLRLALELADLADAISLERFRAADLAIETKPDMSPVTEADKAIEHALRERIVQARPDDAVLGEEEGLSGEGPRRWILDPIDGTKNYSRGIPIFGTLIALEVEGELQVGVVSAPALRRRWWAERGQGAFADGKPIHVSKIAHVDEAVFSGLGDGFGAAEAALAAESWHGRGFGDFWQHMLVAEGAAEVGLDPLVNLWDCAAPMIIVEEAGGRFTDLAGERRADGGSALSTNGLLHETVLAAVRAQ